MIHLLTLVTALQARVVHHLAGTEPAVAGRRGRADAGQTTAEYALVLVGVAAIALLVVAWATDTNKIGRLFDGVLDSILEQLP